MELAEASFRRRALVSVVSTLCGFLSGSWLLPSIFRESIANFWLIVAPPVVSLQRELGKEHGEVCAHSHVEPTVQPSLSVKGWHVPWTYEVRGGTVVVYRRWQVLAPQLRTVLGNLE